MTTKQSVCFFRINETSTDTLEDQIKKAIEQICDSMTTIDCVTPINRAFTNFMILYTETII
jgi:hypothetical protein